MHKPLLAAGLLVVVAGGALLAIGVLHVGEKPARLTWREPEIRPLMMTFAYKVYSKPKADFGRHYLSKMVFKNDGDPTDTHRPLQPRDFTKPNSFFMF